MLNESRRDTEHFFQDSVAILRQEIVIPQGARFMNFSAVIFLFSVILTSTAWAQEMSGVMMVVKGDIKVTSAKDAKTEAAKIGKKVFAGDTIVAGADSRAKIVMSDKNILNISPDSKVIIEKYTSDAKSDAKNVEIKVEYGKVRAQVEQKYDGEKSKFNIKTPTAVAGVRGTDFVTSFNRETRQSAIVTFSGMVAVGTPGPRGEIQNPVFVRPGQTTNVGEGKAPEAPKALPKEDLKNMNQETSASNSNQTAPESEPSKQQAEGKSGDKEKKEPTQDSATKDPKQASDQPSEPKKEQNTARQDEPNQKNPNEPGPANSASDKKREPTASPEASNSANGPNNSGPGGSTASANAPTNGDSTNKSPAGTQPAKEGSRSPASVVSSPNTGMSPSAQTGPAMPPAMMPSMGPVMVDQGAMPTMAGPQMPKMPAQMPTVNVPPTNSFINEVIRNGGGKTRTTVILK